MPTTSAITPPPGYELLRPEWKRKKSIPARCMVFDICGEWSLIYEPLTGTPFPDGVIKFHHAAPIGTQPPAPASRQRLGKVATWRCEPISDGVIEVLEGEERLMVLASSDPHEIQAITHLVTRHNATLPAWEGQWQPIETAPKDGAVIIVPGGIAHWRNGAWNTLTCEPFPGRPIQWEVKIWQPFPEHPKS